MLSNENPLIKLNQWIIKSRLAEDDLIELILAYLPGYYDKFTKSATVGDIIKHISEISDPIKQYGVCFFIYHFLQKHFTQFDLDLSTVIVDDALKRKLKLKKSWDELVNSGFNPDSFDEWLLKSHEKALYGED